ALFLGAKPEYQEAGIYHAYTLEETAVASVQLSNGEEVKFTPSSIEGIEVDFEPEQKGIKAYYSGGTLASEAEMMIKHTMNAEEIKDEGFTYTSASNEVIDLGVDMYTQSKPHTMIDP